MSARIRQLLPFVLLLFTISASAGIRPSFSLDYSAWEATDIVIVSEGEVIDGNFVVLESLKGDVFSGESIYVPELGKFADKSSRLVKIPWGGKTDNPPKYVSGVRMILFLKRKPPAAGPQEVISPPAWRPANLFDEMNASVVWLEEDKSFAFQQLMNPGPSELVEFGRSESEIRVRTLEVMQFRADFNRAASIADGSIRAEALAAFTSSEFFLSRVRAFEELEKRGQESVSVLLKILHNETKLNLHGSAIRSLIAIGGPRVGPALTDSVRREMLFWKVTAPQLKPGWWNSVSESDVDRLQSRYTKLRLSLEGLRLLRFLDAKQVVSELRKFWPSVPRPDTNEDVDGITKDCDQFLEELNK